MKWLDNWILQRAKRIRSRDETGTSIDRVERGIGLSMKEAISIGGSKHRMNFTVYRANGGLMVEYNRYDERKDQHLCELHIIHPDQNLGDALAKIVTFESLKSSIKLQEIEQTV
jgi:hypothetical protein